MVEQLLVGVAEVDITPPVGLPMDGYIARSGVSQGVHDPLLAQVLIFDDGQQRAAIVTLDLVAVSALFSDTIRYRLAHRLNTRRDAVLICASHTHAGPTGLQDWFPVGMSPTLNSQLTDMIRQRVDQAARDALERLTPARLSYSVGPVEGVGMDRNQPRPAPDPSVTVLSFNRPDGTPVAIVVHYACHPTILGPQLEYSADFPGAARQRIQARYPGACCLYINGAAGNISTRFTRRDQTFDEVARLGGLLGDRVIALMEHTQFCESGLSAHRISMELPFRALAATPRVLPLTGIQRIDETRAEGAAIERLLARNIAGRTSLYTTLGALHVGPWRLLTVPGEAFNELAAALRQASPFALVAGYTNDYLGYFPTQAAIDQETYEALSSPYDARALQQILDALLTML